MRKFSTDQLLTAGIAVVVLTIAFIVLVSVRQSRQLDNTSREVDHTEQVLKSVQQLVLNTLDNETGARGYVITADSSFLEPLSNSNQKFTKELSDLRGLVTGKPQQLNYLDSLQYYINKRLAFSDSLVQVTKRYVTNPAINMIRQGDGKFYTDKIRQFGNLMEQHESGLLAEGKTQNNLTIHRLNIILFAVLAMLLLLLFLFVRRISSDIKNQNASEKKFRALLDAAPDAKVIVDENGIITMINQQTERVFGYTKEELIGKPVEILMPEDFHVKHVPQRNSYIENPKVRPMGSGLELFALKKNGQRFPVEISLSPIHTDEGLLVSASVRDVTARKKMENELRKTNAELEAFTYSVSHDLRAPLRGIIGFANILDEDYGSKLDDEAKRITGIIKQNTQKMGQLIDDLLAFSRLGRMELVKTSTDMGLLARDVIRDLTVSGDAARIKWEISTLPKVHADIKVMKQVWVNLISNAIKYTGKIAEPEIKIGYMKQDGNHIFFISDNGAGFDAKYKGKLFRVFQRLHSENEFEGTGVGLALVEKIVSRHGGTVWAEGEVNKGASFYFSIPPE